MKNVSILKIAIQAVVLLIMVTACASSRSLGRQSRSENSQTTTKTTSRRQKPAKDVEQEKARKEQEKALKQQEKARKEQEKALKQQEKALKQQEKASQKQPTRKLGRSVRKPTVAPDQSVAVQTSKVGIQDSVNSQEVVREVIEKDDFIQQVDGNRQTARFITSKLKFTLEVGHQQMTLTGNLKMKRNDVIRLQLMAFGFVEAGRLEFTKDYMLIVDRINKQYLKVPYAQLDFMRNSGVDFDVLQSLFWNEIYRDENISRDKALNDYTAEVGTDNHVVVGMEKGKLSYRWLVDRSSALVEMANILFSDRYRGNFQLNWNYEKFKRLDRHLFPMTHQVQFSTPNKEVKFSISLNYVGNEENWETRTKLSGKYRQVEIGDLLSRFMAL